MTDLQALIGKWRKIADARIKGPWRMEYTPMGPCGQVMRREMIYAIRGEREINIVRRPGFDSLGPGVEINNAMAIVVMERLFDALLDVAEAASYLEHHSSYCSVMMNIKSAACVCGMAETQKALARLAEVGNADV